MTSLLETRGISSLDSPKISEIASKIGIEKFMLLTAPTGYGKTVTIPIVLLLMLITRHKRRGASGNPNPRILLLLPNIISVDSHIQHMKPVFSKYDITYGKGAEMEITYTEDTQYVVATYGHAEATFMGDISLVKKNKRCAQFDVIFCDEYHTNDSAIDTVAGIFRTVVESTNGAIMTSMIFMTATPSPLPAKIEYTMKVELGVESERKYDIIYKSVPTKKKTPPHYVAYRNSVISTLASMMKEVFDNHDHVLVFLPTLAMIRSAAKSVATVLPQSVEIKELNSRSSRELRDSIVQDPGPGRRSIILSTNVAESSITIPYTTCVIDSMLVNQARFDYTQGQVMQIQFETQKSATQRAGRVGRVARNGARDTVYRLMSQKEFEALDSTNLRGIHYSDNSKLFCNMMVGVGYKPGNPGSNRPMFKLMNLLDIGHQFAPVISALIKYNILSKMAGDVEGNITIDGVTFPGFHIQSQEDLARVASIPLDFLEAVIIAKCLRMDFEPYPITTLMALASFQHVFYNASTETQPESDLRKLCADWNTIVQNEMIRKIDLTDSDINKLSDMVLGNVSRGTLKKVSKSITRVLMFMANKSIEEFKEHIADEVSVASDRGTLKQYLAENYHDIMNMDRHYPKIGAFNSQELITLVADKLTSFGLEKYVVSKSSKGFSFAKPLSGGDSLPIAGSVKKGSVVLAIKIITIASKKYITGYLVLDEPGSMSTSVKRSADERVEVVTPVVQEARGASRQRFGKAPQTIVPFDSKNPRNARRVGANVVRADREFEF